MLQKITIISKIICNKLHVIKFILSGIIMKKVPFIIILSIVSQYCFAMASQNHPRMSHKEAERLICKHIVNGPIIHPAITTETNTSSRMTLNLAEMPEPLRALVQTILDQHADRNEDITLEKLAIQTYNALTAPRKIQFKITPSGCFCRK